MPSHACRPLAARLALAACALLLAGGLSACTSPSGAPPGPQVLSYRVGPPDQLRITILPDPIIEREAIVRPDGMISVDLIGDVAAAGRTTEEIASDIQTRIGRFKRDARVTVALGAALSSEITVLGEVNRPSTVPLARQTRIVEALGTVGDTTVFAAKSRIRLIRTAEGKTQVFTVNLKAIEKGNLGTNYLLQGGDLVYVPPGVMATIGYALQAALFPFHQLLGFGGNVTTTVLTGGL
jgi:polysaccharide export outer membrane protein